MKQAPVQGYWRNEDSSEQEVRAVESLLLKQIAVDLKLRDVRAMALLAGSELEVDRNMRVSISDVGQVESPYEWKALKLPE